MSRPDVAVVAGGWSVYNVDLATIGGTIIAVNDSALYLPRWDFALSMDRLWAEDRLPKIAAMIETGRKKPDPGAVWIRYNALQNMREQAAGWPWVQPFECDHEKSVFTVAEGRLNGTNSGACALNLAWLLHPGRVFLFGFDMNRDQRGRAYWYPPYPWSNSIGSTTDGKYARWSTQFRDACAAFKLIGTEVYNVSPKSSVKTWPRITPAEHVRMMQ